jgi:hypothetical protein
MEVFLTTHENYNYEEICCALEETQNDKIEFINYFISRVLQINHRFHESDKSFRQEFLDWCSYLLSILEEEELSFDHEKIHIVTHIFFLNL